MKQGILVLLVTLSSCFSRTAMMTQENYYSIDLGTPVKALEQQVGTPYAVYHLSNGRLEYEYIERINMGNRLLTENHYFLTISDGKVVSKRFTTEQPPAYDLMYESDPNYPTFPSFP